MLTRIFISFFALLVLQPAYALLSDDDLLSPEDAFKPSLRLLEPGVLEARWEIADGYYLYRDKFNFTTDTAGITLQDAVLPRGEVKDDEFFGRIETLRNEVIATIPYQGEATDLTLLTAYQGCADVGICYPPQKTSLNVKLASATVNAATGFDVLGGLRDEIGLGGEQELLPADEAFAFTAGFVDGKLRAEWQIAEGYHLYKDKIKMELPGITLGTPDFRATDFTEEDPELGKLESYRGLLTLNYPVKPGLPGGPVELKAEYQGCADQGVCYPPVRKTLQLIAGAEAASVAVATSGTGSSGVDGQGGGTAPPVSEQDALTSRLMGGNTALTLLMFFGLGLGLAFTPCVFPMIPILSGIIISSAGEKVSTQKAFMLSLAYVLAMAFTYTIVGVLAGLFGANLQIWFQNPWVLGTFATLFVLLSLSMFGFYELQMPASIQNKLTSISNRQEGGKLASAAIMGFLSALIVGPCVTAPLIAALAYIGQTGDAVLGGLALFSLSMGMGAPLLMIGASAGKLLPRAGGWMDTVKAVFGVLMLGVAIWLLERVLPTAITMTLWALLLIISGIYMGVLQHLPEAVSGWRKLWKGFGYIAVLYGSLILIGVAGGSNNLYQPLKGLSGTAECVAGSLNCEAGTVMADATFQQIKGIAGLEQGLQAAQSQNKPVMLDFYADWCVSCKEMEHQTFADARVKRTMSQAVLLQADVTKNDAEDRALLKRFGIFGPPAILFFDTQGKEKKAYRVVGFMKADAFNQHADRAFN